MHSSFTKHGTGVVFGVRYFWRCGCVGGQWFHLADGGTIESWFLTSDDIYTGIYFTKPMLHLIDNIFTVGFIQIAGFWPLMLRLVDTSK